MTLCGSEPKMKLRGRGREGRVSTQTLDGRPGGSRRLSGPAELDACAGMRRRRTAAKVVEVGVGEDEGRVLRAS